MKEHDMVKELELSKIPVSMTLVSQEDDPKDSLERQQLAFNAIRGLEPGGWEWLKILLKSDHEVYLEAQRDKINLILNRLEFKQKKLEFERELYTRWTQYIQEVCAQIRQNPFDHGYTQQAIDLQLHEILNQCFENDLARGKSILEGRDQIYNEGQPIRLKKGSQGYEQDEKIVQKGNETFFEACRKRLKELLSEEFDLNKISMLFDETAERLSAEAEEVCNQKIANIHAFYQLTDEREKINKKKRRVCRRLLPSTNDLSLEALPKETINRIESLISSHLSPNLIDPDPGGNENTLLHKAILANHLRSVECLLEYGANPFIKNRQGHSAIQVALDEDKIELLITLLKHLQHKVVLPVSKIEGTYSSQSFNPACPFYEFPSLLPEERDFEAIHEVWQTFLAVKKQLDHGFETYLEIYESFLCRLFSVGKEKVQARFQEVAQLYEQLYSHYSELKLEEFRMYYRDEILPDVPKSSVLHTSFYDFLNSLKYHKKIIENYVKRTYIKEFKVGDYTVGYIKALEEDLIKKSEEVEALSQRTTDQRKELQATQKGKHDYFLKIRALQEVIEKQDFIIEDFKTREGFSLEISKIRDKNEEDLQRNFNYQVKENQSLKNNLSELEDDMSKLQKEWEHKFKLQQKEFTDQLKLQRDEIITLFTQMKDSTKDQDSEKSKNSYSPTYF